MNHTTLILIVFSFLASILIFAIWSNTHVFAQQLPSSVSSSSASPAAGNRSSSSSSSSSSPSNAISPELKEKMCDPSNPSLKVVNTTESKICGIPKTIKPSLLSSAAGSSSSSPQTATTTTTTTKPTTSATNVATPTPKQQQQIATINKNNTNASSRPINSTAGVTIAPVSNPTNKSLSSASPSPPAPSAIAPQVKAINQQQQKQPITRINGTAQQVKAVDEQQQPPAPSPVTLVNGTDIQNDSFVATPPVVSSGKLLYLGYHDGGSGPINSNSSPNYKSSSDSKPSIGRSTSTTYDNDSTEKKKEKNSSAKLDRDDSTNGDSSQKDKSSSDSKPSTPHIRITAPDNDSIEKKKASSATKLTKSDVTTNDNNIIPKEKSSPDTTPSNPPPHIKITAPDNDASSKKSDKKITSSTKLDRDDSTNDKSSSFDSKSSSQTNDGSESPSSSELPSSIRNKPDSIIINSPGEVRHNLFGFSDHGS